MGKCFRKVYLWHFRHNSKAWIIYTYDYDT